MVRYKVPDPDDLCCCETREEATALADLWQESAGVRRWIFENGTSETKVVITGESIEVRDGE